RQRPARPAARGPQVPQSRHRPAAAGRGARKAGTLMSPRPSPSPHPALAGASETPTGEYAPAQPAQPRATVDYVDSWAERFKKYLALGAAIGGLVTGGGVAASHFSATEHADKAVNERTA